MKRSDMTVSMPMTAFEELEEFKMKYQELRAELRSCFDTAAFDAGDETSINFDVIKALNVARKTLSPKYNGVYVHQNV